MFFHGLIEIPFNDNFHYLGKQGDYCQVTTYLPEYEKFGVVAADGTWITFNWTEEEFLKTFDYFPPEKCYNLESLHNYDY